MYSIGATTSTIVCAASINYQHRQHNTAMYSTDNLTCRVVQAIGTAGRVLAWYLRVAVS